MNETDETLATTKGRAPHKFHGAVNTPVYRASTILFPSLDAFRDQSKVDYTYARQATPTSRALEEAITALEGEKAARTVLTPSGTSAVAIALLSQVESGDHIIAGDNIYSPSRRIIDSLQNKFNITADYIPANASLDNIASLITTRTKVIFVESPGSLTFEMCDIPALATLAHKHNAKLIVDNTWASAYFFKPLDKGADISLQSASKHILGHSDALLGTITATENCAYAVRSTHKTFGHCVGADDAYLALRGLRTMPTRLKQHMKNALDIAHLLQQYTFIRDIRYPALASDPGYTLWKRDFTGAASLFGIITEPIPEDKLAAMLDNMRHFGMGYGFGGYESLMIPASPRRTAQPWDKENGQLLRLHIGLEHSDDLKADLEDGFKRAGLL